MAKRIEGITIVYDADNSKLLKTNKEINQALKNTGSDLANVNQRLKLDPKNVVLLRQKIEVLGNSIEANVIKIKKLKDEQKKFEKGSEGWTKAERKIQAAETKIQQYNKALEETVTDLKKVGGIGQKELGKIGIAAEKASTKLKGISESTGTFADKTRTASMGATIALATLTAGATTFEDAWTGVTKTVDGTPKQLEAIKIGILKLAQETSSSSEEIAGVAEAAGQLGIKTTDVLKFTETMVKLGDTTNLSAVEGASALAKFANVTKLSAKDYDNLGAAIVDLGNNSATTEQDIVNMATRLAAAGTISGMSQPDILAISTALSSVGIEAEAGGSSMSKFIKRMQIAAETGNADLGKLASVAGMSADEFKKAFEEDSAGALNSFIIGLGKSEEKGTSMTKVLKDLGIEDVRQSNALLSLASSSDVLSDSLEISNNAWNANTALTEEARKKYETTIAKLNQAKEAIKLIAVSMGEALLPVVNFISEGVKKLANRFANMSDTAKLVISTILLVVAALAPVLKVFSVITGSLGKVIALVGSVSLPILAAVAAITAVILIIKKAYTENEAFRAQVNHIVNFVLKNLSVFLKETLIPAFMALVNFFKTSILPTLNTFVQFIATYILPVILTMVEVIITKIIPAVGSFVKTLAVVLIPILTTLYEVYSKYILPVLTFFMKIVIKIASFVLKNLAKWIGFVVTSWLGFAKAILYVVNVPIKLILKFVKFLMKGLNTLKSVFGKVKSAFADSSFGQAFIRALEKIKGLIDTVKGGLKKLKDGFSNAAGKIANVLGFGADGFGFGADGFNGGSMNNEINIQFVVNNEGDFDDSNLEKYSNNIATIVLDQLDKEFA